MNKTVLAVVVIAVVVLALPLVVRSRGGERGAGEADGPAPSVKGPSVGDPYAMTAAELGNSMVECAALGAAILTGDRQRVQAFLDGGADINRKLKMRRNGGSPSMEPPLSLAILAVTNTKATADLVQFLIDKGADVDSRSGKGFTSLHLAVIFGREDLVQILVSSGANVNARDSRGQTPLLLAEQRCPSCIEVLRQHGATK